MVGAGVVYRVVPPLPVGDAVGERRRRLVGGIGACMPERSCGEAAVMPDGTSETLLALINVDEGAVMLSVLCGCSLLVFRRYAEAEFADLVAVADGQIAMLCTHCDTMHWPRFVLADVDGG